MDYLEEQFKKMISTLYDNVDISIGAHGTGVVPDKKHERAKAICEEGLICRYGDLRRTVALQDRGFIHAHGNIDIADILTYNYKKHEKGYRRITQQEGNRIILKTEVIDLEQCTFLVGIPAAIKTTDSEIFENKKRFKMDYAKSEEELRIGKEMEGKVLNPKYIVGYFMNGNIDTFIPNEKFYGFKEFKESEKAPEIDVEAISKLNKQVKIREEEKDKKDVQELGKETIEQQKNTKNKNIMVKFMERLKINKKTKTKDIEK